MNSNYLTSETLVRNMTTEREISGLISLSERIVNPDLRDSIIAKIEAYGQKQEARYAEVINPDGSTLVKHPGIGFVTINESVLDEPIRLFASRVNSMSSLRVCVYQADALVDVDGSVSYVNRVLLSDMEMTQAAFNGLISSGNGNCFPGTIRNLQGIPVSFDGDINSIRTKIIMNDTLKMTEGLNQWVMEIVEKTNAAAQAGGTLSQKSRSDISKVTNNLISWTDANPGYYAKRLGEFTEQTTADIKLEVHSLTKNMENK